MDLKIGISRHTGARCFSFLCLLLLCWPPGASLTVEYPSESAPPCSGEDGGEFPPPPAMGRTLGGLPHGLAEAVQPDLLPLLSSVDPTLTAEGGALPMSCGVESDSLEASVRIDGPWPLAHDWCPHHSDATTMQHQPFTRGRGLTAK